MAGLTGLDIIVLTMIIVGGALGFSRGFVQEALSLIAWILGILAVRLFHTPVTRLVESYVETESGASVLAFVLLFGVTFGLGKWLSTSLGTRVRDSALGSVDRLLGSGFGMIKGLIVATLLFLLLSLAHGIIFGVENKPEWMVKSRTYPLLNASAAALSDFADAYQGKEGDPATSGEEAKVRAKQ
jgi:membrane protein required for colicin V production